jgi:hypothetical protein
MARKKILCSVTTVGLTELVVGRLSGGFGALAAFLFRIGMLALR